MYCQYQLRDDPSKRTPANHAQIREPLKHDQTNTTGQT